MEIRKKFGNSSAIKEIKWSSYTNTVSVEFMSGGIYDYYDVPQEKIEGWLKADSKGKYFHKEIKAHGRV